MSQSHEYIGMGASSITFPDPREIKRKTMTKELITTDTFSLDYGNKDILNTLRNTMALGATDDEFKMFVLFCQSTGLNPLKKEIWFIKTKGYTKKDGTSVDGRVQMMTGINGYLAIANNHPMFDGMECEIKKELNQPFPEYAIAKVWRKDRKYPSTAQAFWKEYCQPGINGRQSIWDQKPSIMIAKVAKSIALREAFPQEMGGLYTEEEMPKEFSADSSHIPITEADEPPKKIIKEVIAQSQESNHQLNHLYYIPQTSKPQLEFLTKAGCVQIEYSVYGAPRDLGEKLEAYKITREEYEQKLAGIRDAKKRMLSKAKTIVGEQHTIDSVEFKDG